MRHLPFATLILASVLLVAADKKPGKAKEPAPSAAQIKQWVKQLGDESFKVREEATRDLIKAGKVALDAVTKATKSEDAEVKQRALSIIKHPEKVAVAYFKKLRGKVTFDQKNSGKPVIGLYLRFTKITDAGLVHLKGLTKLEKLNLWSTEVTDAGLLHLKGLVSLRELFLNDTQVTDAGLVHLKGLTELQWLILHQTQVTDAGLAHLKGLTELQSLYLGYTHITDAGLVHLKGLDNLQMLDLMVTQVTDAGLVHLKGLTSLQELRLRGTKVTQSGIEKLQTSLPDCKIKWDPK